MSFVFSIQARSPQVESDDRAEVFEHGDTLVVVVADGAGGVRGGKLASAAVIDGVRASISHREFDAYDLGGWTDMFARLDVELTSRLVGETTAVIVVAGARGIFGVSTGDSEGWVVSAGGVDDLTASQARRRLGSGRSTATPFHRHSLDGTLIVGTDGLFNHVDARSITASVTGTVTEVAGRLAGLPRLSSGGYPDDVAVVVVQPGNQRSPSPS